MPAQQKPSHYTFIKWLLVTVGAIVLLLLIAGPIVSRYAQSAITDLLAPLGGTVEDVSVNLFRRQIEVKNISVYKTTQDESIPDSIRISSVAVRGVSIYQWLLNKKVDVRELEIRTGFLRINLATLRHDSTKNGDDNPLKGVHVGRISIRDLTSALADNQTRVLEGVINLDVFGVSSTKDSVTSIGDYVVDAVEARLKKIKFYESNGLYEIRVSSVDLNTEKQELLIDTLYVVPLHAKYRFARIVGKQTDRLSMFIQSINATGLQYGMLRDSSVVARKIEISGAEIYSFRDKRRPFRETKKKLLPMELLAEIRYPIEIDTIKISKANVTYEEFPEDGFESGKVTFQDLRATFSNISNRTYYNKPKYATLAASTRLMGKGNLEAVFQLPIGGGTYHAKGRLSRFSLAHLNPALENLAFISVETGRLNDMDFAFDYTDKASTGKLTINYSDLKIKGLKKQADSEKNELKSLIINAIVKTNKDSNTPEDKRTGEISFERDQQRQIFNFWWKSLLSGIRSGVVGKKAS